MAELILKYGDTADVASATSMTLEIAWFDDMQPKVIGTRHELVNYAEMRDVAGVRLRLHFKLGVGNLDTRDKKAAILNWLTARHRWAVVTDSFFVDEANDAHDYAVKCEPTSDDQAAGMIADGDLGIEVLSTQVYSGLTFE